MTTTTGRPAKSHKWITSCPVTIAKKDITDIFYTTVNSIGIPTAIKREYQIKDGVETLCTVILGHKPIPVYISPLDHVWTCRFNSQGRLSAVGTMLNGESIIGEELTVILCK